MDRHTRPEKTRELHSNHFDSTIWNDFNFREDDIIISTYAKSGTTWMQQIVAQLIFDGAAGLPVSDMSPWMDLRVPPAPVKLGALEEQKHRRFVKTHLPVDALVYAPQAKYIYIARDGRDVLWSLYNHHVSASEVWYDTLNNTPGLVGPPMEEPIDDIRQYYHDWLDKDGYPFWSFWENLKSWWDIRNLPNLMLVHFNDLKKDLAGNMRKIASFLEIEVDESLFPSMVEHSTFTYMKTKGPWSGAPGWNLVEGGQKLLSSQGNKRTLAGCTD